jgi:hypothetical protein
MEFVDLEHEALDDVGGVDLVFDVIGRDVQKRSAGLAREWEAPFDGSMCQPASRLRH